MGYKAVTIPFQAQGICEHNFLPIRPRDSLRILFNTAFQATTTNQIELALALKPICPSPSIPSHLLLYQPQASLRRSHRHWASARTEWPTLESGRRLIYFLQCSLPPIPYSSEPPYSHKMVSHEDNSSSCVFTSHGGGHFHSLFQQTFTECNTDKSLKERGRCGGRVTLQIMKGLTVWVKGRIAHIDGLCLH